MPAHKYYAKEQKLFSEESRLLVKDQKAVQKIVKRGYDKDVEGIRTLVTIGRVARGETWCLGLVICVQLS